MIKFFRKIRYDLMGKNKTGQYLKYAIGEIVLVVIGILIALSINNWNEVRKVQTKERFALKEITSDLDLNISSLNRIVYTDNNNITKCINSLNIIITNMEHTKVYNDSLADYFMRNFSYPDLDVKSSGYESLTSIGMDLISDNELRSEIGKYYTYSIPDAKAAYQELRDDFYHYMLDLLRTEFISVGTDNDTKKVLPVNYESLLTNRVYIESLKAYLSVYNFYLNKSLEVIEESKKLKQQIEHNLNNNDKIL
jgi:hypothetical protein